MTHSQFSAVLGAVFLVACGNTGAPAADYGPLLKNLTEQVILPEHQAFAARADALDSAVQVLASAPDADSLASAQLAWREARKGYRLLDALHFGPDYALHITERIDAAPADAEAIAAWIDGNEAVDVGAVEKAGGASKGFLGLECLLFSEAGEASLASDEAGAARRRALAVSMASEIASSAHELDDAWDPRKGGFATDLELAGAGSRKYATQRAAVDDLVGGAAYALEWIVGVRLAPPLGKQTGGTPRPELDPTVRSDSALSDLQASLAGVFALYARPGFSTVVGARGAGLDQAVLGEFEGARAAFNAVPAPFSDAVANQTALVEAAYDAGRALKKTWNSDVSSALGATVKPSDNDGD